MITSSSANVLGQGSFWAATRLQKLALESDTFLLLSCETSQVTNRNLLTQLRRRCTRNHLIWFLRFKLNYSICKRSTGISEESPPSNECTTMNARWLKLFCWKIILKECISQNFFFLKMQIFPERVAPSHLDGSPVHYEPISLKLENPLDSLISLISFQSNSIGSKRTVH